MNIIRQFFFQLCFDPIWQRVFYSVNYSNKDFYAPLKLGGTCSLHKNNLSPFYNSTKKRRSRLFQIVISDFSAYWETTQSDSQIK